MRGDTGDYVSIYGIKLKHLACWKVMSAVERKDNEIARRCSI